MDLAHFLRDFRGPVPLRHAGVRLHARAAEVEHVELGEGPSEALRLHQVRQALDVHVPQILVGLRALTSAQTFTRTKKWPGKPPANKMF